MTAPRAEAELQRTGLTRQTPTEHAAAATEQQGWLARQRAARPWLDHLVRAGLRYNEQKGDYFAAGITYYTLLSLVPLVMVAFAALGFVLVGDVERLNSVRDTITANVPADLRELVTPLIQNAIDTRSTVAVIGLVGALYAGLGWMANIRTALTAQWDQKHPGPGFLRTKLYDLGALVGLVLALVVSFGLSAVGGAGTRLVLEALALDTVPGAFLVTRVLAIVLSVGATWGVFTWVIARLPREPVTLRSAARAALLAAVVFEVFKQVAGLYLGSIVAGPSGAIFGSILGLLVFVFTTSRFLLFATAWAATAAENASSLAVPVPGPAVVTTRVEVSAAPNVRGLLAGVGVGAAAVLGLGWRHRR